MLSLGQAAKQVGKTKTTLTKAIQSGRLSASRNDQGHYCIDPAELFRVYPVNPSRPQPGRPVNSQLVDQGWRQETPSNSSTLHTEIELLRQQIEHLKQSLTHRDDLVADLRRERDKLLNVVEEQAETVKQLTYQGQVLQKKDTDKGGLLSWLLK